MAARRYAFTCFEVDEYDRLANLSHPDVRFLVFQGEEAPITGRVHLQGYVEFKKVVRINRAKTILGLPSAHFEKCRGSAKQNIEYCTKPESAVLEFPPITVGKSSGGKGSRCDLKKVKALIESDASLDTIAEECTSAYIKYHKGIEKLHEMRRAKQRGYFNKRIQVHVLWGDAGAGKTRFVYDKHGHENVFVPVWNGTKYWFSGYTGQNVLLLNEFYGQCRSSFMQDLLDKYRLPVETKGGMVTSYWDHIYLTSNSPPEHWYSKWETTPPGVQISFIRRLDSVTYMEAPKEKKNLTWDSLPTYDEFMSQQSVPTPEVEPEPETEPVNLTIQPEVLTISVKSQAKLNLTKPVKLPSPRRRPKKKRRKRKTKTKAKSKTKKLHVPAQPSVVAQMLHPKHRSITNHLVTLAVTEVNPSNHTGVSSVHPNSLHAPSLTFIPDKDGAC